MVSLKEDGTTETAATPQVAGSYPVGSPHLVRRIIVDHRGKRRNVDLVTIDDKGHELDAAPAASWLLMADDAGKAGVLLRAKTAWRSREYQQRLRERYERYLEYTEALKRGERPEPVLFAALAAKPGWSEHEIGWAVDVEGGADPDSPETHWLNANAERFGWVRTVPGELWHFAWRPHA